MEKTGKKIKSLALCASVALMAGTLAASQLLPVFEGVGRGNSVSGSAETALVSEQNAAAVDTHVSSYLNKDVVQKLPDSLAADREISILVETAESGIMAAYDAQSGISRYASVAEFASSAKGAEIVSRIERRNADAKKYLERSGVSFTYGASYNVLMGGIEVVAKAGDYYRLVSALAGTGYTASISEEYAVCEAQRVDNTVHVHDTGIFNSEGSGYDGSGTVVAVLDTGLDYTHTAFAVEQFKSTNPVMTPATINEKVSRLRAAEYTPGLSAANVYLSAKIPYAYDYADRDTDVYPHGDEHGTHVSGIIVGKDDEITGVAPNAQLCPMKVFSDKTSGARWSWILSALEDCVVLDVDVINMSLGSAAGFTEESDPEKLREKIVYNSVAEHGISLVAAAGNEYNSTFGSEKNGNLGLTSNPDSATIGSPGSYDSALAVASISGVKTPFLEYKGQIIYFTESADQSSETRHFVDDILKNGVNEQEFEYITVPGVGRSSDYSSIENEIKGKIALVRRGDTSFEDKSRVAQRMGAAGVIIYNNVSGDITMTVGSVTIPVCSISRDNGELLASAKRGKITVSKGNTAGPFMSDFSSWGPTPDLRIKPEITAHGGEIYSSVRGQEYDRLSGTSMASPNQAGVTALVRQYVKDKFPQATRPQQLAYTNQIMMSTTDIAKNINGLPYSVRKQGAGLANLTKATTSPAFISTFARDDEAVASQNPDRFTDEVIDKAKIEYGDDKERKGSYQLKFNINNIESAALTYDVDAIVMTEGISENKTYKGDRTVTQEGYILDGAKVKVENVTGDGSQNGNTVTVQGKGTATVVVVITLDEKTDKAYLDQFENGMYVEGYITLTVPNEETVALNVPYLAFYGDWTEAPIFDLDYFETDKDALDDSLATLDKTLPDAYATTPVGGFYSDYISMLGSYVFVQDPAATPISATRDHIALTNQAGEVGGVNYIYGIYAGLLRGAKRVEMSVTDAVTGEVIWKNTEWNQRKSYSAGSSIYPAMIDVDFHMTDYDFKNNTKYIFRAEAILDYPGEQNNKKSVFEFPFVTDFEAPIVTDAQFYTEYDTTAKKNKLFARLYIYDNHYTMGASIGQLVYAEKGSGSMYSLKGFGNYVTPVYSQFNSTSELVVELTDHIADLANSITPNTFSVALYDYAMNQGVYEVRIPDSVKGLYFSEMEHADGTPLGEGEYGVTLSPNQTYVLEPKLYPGTEWRETLTYTSNNDAVAKVVNGKILAVGQGTAVITATSSVDKNAKAQLSVKVLGSGDPGYEEYTEPVVDVFRITGYETNFAFYDISNDDRDLGLTDSVTEFSANATTYSLSMFPSERVTLTYKLIAFDPASTKVLFSSGSEKYVRVDENGQITAVAEGTTSVMVRVVKVNEDGSTTPTMYNRTVMITVKDPYERNGPYLTSYRGGGMQSYTDADGKVHEHAVVIPEELGFTEIDQFAFSGYQYIPKDLSAGDVIDDEDPSATKIWYYGDNSDVEEVVIPEGVKNIGNYAFAGMTSLKRVVLPSTLNRIAMGAFYGCTSLTEVVGLEYVKFISQDAFSGPVVNGRYTATLLTGVKQESFANIVAIGDGAFRGTLLSRINLPASAQSIGAYAFADSKVTNVTIRASKIKLGNYAFARCASLAKMEVNASVIPDGVFEGCTGLEKITLGADVESIGPNAFAGTNIANFTVRSGNPNFAAQNSSSYLLSKDEKTLVQVAPAAGNTFPADNTDTRLNSLEEIGTGAFSSCTSLTSVTLPSVKRVGNYAFYGCEDLSTLHLGALEEIGDYAFAFSGLKTIPTLADTLTEIGSYAFAATALTSVNIAAADAEKGFFIGEGAFAANRLLGAVTIGDNVTVGTGAFQAAYNVEEVTMGSMNRDDGVTVKKYYTHIVSPETLKSVTLGKNVTVGEQAFSYQTGLQQLKAGEGTVIGDGAFYGSSSFTITTNGSISAVNLTADLSKVKSIGADAFSGPAVNMYISFTSKGQDEPDSISDEGSIGWWQAPQITTVNLTSLESLGEGAFAYNQFLGYEEGSLTLSEKLTEIPASAFTYSNLTTVDLKNVTKVGDGAFMASYNLTGVDLSKLTEIGAGAFAANALTSVTLQEGVTVGAEAFYSNIELKEVNGLGGIASIGAGAFAGTAISGDVSLSATSIGDMAFMGTGLTSVTLPETLTYIGENPFAGCPLKPFTKTEEEKFHGKPVGSTTVTDFVINEEAGIEVIGGALYKTTPAGGRVLVTYPMNATAREFVVADNTVRISAFAFMGSSVYAVTLPETVKALGDKAFYGCDKLGIVTFQSYNSPILEEQYDASYTDLPREDEEGSPIEDEDGNYVTNLPSQPAFEIFTDTGATDLGILKFRTMGFDAPNFFFGANFVGYIGKCAGDLIMICPSNGVGYDSFIFSQYFEARIKGAPAADDVTLAAMAAIRSLPDSIMYEHKPLVVEARRLYDLIVSEEQRGIVETAGLELKLTQAEAMIQFYDQEQNPNQPTPPAEEEKEGPDALVITLSVLVGVFGAAAIVAFVLLFLSRRKPQGTAGTDGPQENTAESAEESGTEADGTAEGEESADADSGENGENDGAAPEER